MHERLRTSLKGNWHISALYLLIFVLLLYPLLLYTFPPGADVGHVLALSYTFEGTYVEGPLRHPPIFPFVIFLLFKISLGSLEVFFALTKILGVILTLPLSVSFFLLSKQVGRNRLAAVFGFFLALFNPMFLYEILWSGYPQFLGMTFATLSILWLLRSEEGNKYGEFACALFASLTVGSHSYTAIFLFIFLLLHSAFRALGSEKKIAVLTSVGKVIAMAALFCIPYIIFYLNILHDLKTTSFPATFSLFLDSIRGEILVSQPILGLVLLVPILVVAAFYAKRYRQMAKPIKVLSIMTFAAVLMFFLTPPVSANRVLYLLMIPAIPFVAVGLSHVNLPKVLFGKRGNDKRSRKGWTGVLAIGLILLMATTSITHYYLSVALFTPMSNASLHAFDAIKKDSATGDRVLVSSYWPEFDSWWLEGITQREALERGSVRWFILQSEVERIIIGKTLLFGTHIIDGGNLRLLDASPYWADNTQTIMAVSGAGALGVLSFADSCTNVAARSTANPLDPQEAVYPLSPGETEIANDSSLIVKHLEEWGILEKTLSLNPTRNLALIKYSFDSNDEYSISNVTLGIVSFVESKFEDVKQNGSMLDIAYRHEWEGTDGSFQIKVTGDNATMMMEFMKNSIDGNSHLLLKLKPLSFSTHGAFEIVLEVRMNGIEVGTPVAYSMYDKCEEERIKYIYFRGESWLRKKFEQDPHFLTFFNESDVVVYKLA